MDDAKSTSEGEGGGSEEGDSSGDSLESAAEADGEYVECVNSDAGTREHSRRNKAKYNKVISDGGSESEELGAKR
jgi:hypothetical protein